MTSYYVDLRREDYQVILMYNRFICPPVNFVNCLVLNLRASKCKFILSHYDRPGEPSELL